MHLPPHVTVVEVGLRDGLQSEQVIIPTDRKIAFAAALVEAGLPGLELTSFVHPGAVPQLADAESVFAGVERKAGVRYGALVLNRKGAERAVKAGVPEIRYSTMVSETFSQRNAQMSVAQSLRQLQETRDLCLGLAEKPDLVGVLGTCFGCPFEGAVPTRQVLCTIDAFLSAGVKEVTLCDTTGMANPLQVQGLCAEIARQWPELAVSLHFHNTRGMGLANVFAGLDAGITRYESSVGGLGGCPFAPGANGNIATEDLVHMLDALGVATGIHLESVIAVARHLEMLLGRTLPGQVMKAGPSLT